MRMKALFSNDYKCPKYLHDWDEQFYKLKNDNKTNRQNARGNFSYAHLYKERSNYIDKYYEYVRTVILS